MIYVMVQILIQDATKIYFEPVLMALALMGLHASEVVGWQCKICLLFEMEGLLSHK